MSNLVLEGCEIRKVLVTSAWPYINVIPHIGNLVGSVLSADVVAKYFRLKDEDVLMVSGSDEHGTPIEVEAIRLGLSPKHLTDTNHAKVTALFSQWGIDFDNYTRTESPVHKEFVKNHLMKIYKNGYFFIQETTMLYCTDCNRYLPDRFVEGQCPYCGYVPARGDQCDTCGRLLEPIIVVEPYCVICHGTPVKKQVKHWYFDLPKFSSELTKYIRNNKQLPNNAKKFSLNLIKEGLKPRAVTRDIVWGIPAPFPGAENKTIYVWVEAVLGYVSATIEHFQKQGDPGKWKDFWFNKNTKTLYFIGKDNIPFHTIILPALLLASKEGYNLPWNVSSTEFLQFKGEKASKSQRRGIWIDEAIALFPPDYWRYFLIATRPETKDSNFSWKIFREKINSDLNDSFGNFVHRTLTFINTRFSSEIPQPTTLDEQVLTLLKDKVAAIAKEIEDCKLHSAANTMISISRFGNQYLNDWEPWHLIKNDSRKAGDTIYMAAQIVKTLAIVSHPFIPFSAENLWITLNLLGKIRQRWPEALTLLPPKHKIAKAKPLFQKISLNEHELEQKLQSIRKRS